MLYVIRSKTYQELKKKRKKEPSTWIQALEPPFGGGPMPVRWSTPATTLPGSISSATGDLQLATLPSLISSIANIAIAFPEANQIQVYLNL
jgi:hypothetical protein